MPHFFKNFPLTGYKFKKNSDTTTLIVDIFRHVSAYNTVDDANAYQYYTILEGERPDQVSQKLYDSDQYFWTFFLLNEHLAEGHNYWPKEYNVLQDYISLKYPDKVISSMRNSGYNSGENHLLLDVFEVGETVLGDVTGSTAVIKEIDSTRNLMIVTDVDGTFASDTTLTGQSSSDTLVNTDVYRFTLEEEHNAPHHYENSDGQEIPRIIFSEDETSVFEVTNREYEENKNDERMFIRVLRREFIADFAEAYKKLINQ
jgi:hypothetical protein